MSKKHLTYAISFFVILLLSATIWFWTTKQTAMNDNTIRYVAIGDSYTIGESVSRNDSWPELLAAHLRAEGVEIELVANPSVSGWTTQMAIDQELPVYEQAKPTFATLLIGANDNFQGLPEEEFRLDLATLLDGMLKPLPNKRNLVVLTIPDFSVTEAGQNSGNALGYSQSIQKYNTVIKEEAAKRNLRVVDITPVTREMGNDLSLVLADGLHPSAKEYAVWEKLVYPVVFELLK